MSRSEWVVLVAIFFAIRGLGQPVIIELKNGDRITGRVISETTNRVVLSNAWSPELSVPLAQISRRVADTNGATIAGASTNIIGSNAVAFAKAVASTNNFFTSPALKNWHGELQVGADLTFSERNREIYNGRAKVTYLNKKFKSIFDYDTTYGRSEVIDTTTGKGDHKMETDANRMSGSVKSEYDFTKKWYVYNLGGAGYDEIRKIDLRYEIGPGVGYRAIQASNFFVNVEGGANYQVEEHSDGSSIDTFYFRLAQNATWKVTPRLTWDEKFEYTPRVEDLSMYRMRFETNIRYAMLQNIFLNLSLVDTYDSQPASGVPQNDVQLRSSVGVKF